MTTPSKGDAEVPLMLREMTAQDVDAVLEIERGFAAPWTRSMFEQEVGQSGPPSTRVAVLGTTLVGYALWWYVADEVHIVNVAVHPAHRRRGIARRLLTALFDLGRARGMTIATLEVRFHNAAAIALYEGLGFRMVAIRKAYYADNGEDALVMLKGLLSGGPDPGGPRLESPPSAPWVP